MFVECIQRSEVEGGHRCNSNRLLMADAKRLVTVEFCNSKCPSTIRNKPNRERTSPRPVVFKQVPVNGPGTELANLLASLGIRASDCSCATSATAMNAWGIDGCREHRAEIVAWLREQADKRGWGAKLAAGLSALVTLPFGLGMIVDPYGALVDEAIRRSESYDVARMP